MPSKDPRLVRSDYSGRLLKAAGKAVPHHIACEGNMCDGWPYCRIVDENGGGWRIDYLHRKGEEHLCDALCRTVK